MDRSAAKRKAGDKTLMKRKKCFHKALVEFMCQFSDSTVGFILCNFLPPAAAAAAALSTAAAALSAAAVLSAALSAAVVVK